MCIAFKNVPGTSLWHYSKIKEVFDLNLIFLTVVDNPHHRDALQ